MEEIGGEANAIWKGKGEKERGNFKGKGIGERK